MAIHRRALLRWVVLSRRRGPTALSSGANESTPSRHHRAKTTPQEGSIKFLLTCFTSRTLQFVSPGFTMNPRQRAIRRPSLQDLERSTPAAD
jgi:hypothetical protein